jgi:hypothetical protein
LILSFLSGQKNEELRKKRNEERSQKMQAAVQEWEAAKKEAKAAKIKVKDWVQDHPKPMKKNVEFAPELAIPRPKLQKENDGDVADDEEQDFNENGWTDDDE